MSDKSPEFESNAITVTVRARPFNAREIGMKAIQCLDFNGSGKISIWEKGTPASRNVDVEAGGRSHPYTFDHAYDASVSQEQVYKDVGRPVLAASLKGFNTCIFAYGQTGSGKSYAMMGPQGGRDAQKDPGVIPRLCTDLFREVAEKTKANQEEIEAVGNVEEHEKPAKLEFRVEVQYIEIYQEKVKCLINPKKDNLKVRQHPTMGVFVENLTEMEVHSYDDIWKLIDDGNNVRQVASTNMNDQSSRSHAIFIVNVCQKRITVTKDGTQTTTERRSKINLVDLAGSERAKSTGASGETLREGANINKSLSILGLVISGLAEQSKNPTAAKKPFIPFRDSTLTWLLKESLGGNSRTFMVSTLSPAHVNYDETHSTLRYADRAKAIVTKSCVNESASDKKIRELEEEVVKLQEMLKKFQERQDQQEKIGKVVPKLNLGGVSSPVAKKPSTSMPRPEVQKVGGPRSASNQSTAKPSLKKEGSIVRHHSEHKELPMVTPRSAIDRVVTVDEVLGDDEADFVEETPLLMDGSTPRFEEDVAEAKQQLALAEELRKKLAQSDDQRHEQQEKEMKERAEAMKTSLPVVKASRGDPYILNLDRAGDWVMLNLVSEESILGTGSAPEEKVVNCQFVTIEGEGVAEQHCSLVKNTVNNQVILRPFEGCDTYIDPDEDPIHEEVVLTSGMQFYLGDELFGFKFEDPADKPITTARKRSATMKSGAPKPPVSFSGTPGSQSGLAIGAPAPSSGASTPASTSPPPTSVGSLSLNLPNTQRHGSNLTPPIVSPIHRSGSPEPTAPRPAIPSLSLGGGGAPGASQQPMDNLARSSNYVDPKQMGQRPRGSSMRMEGSTAEGGPARIRTPRIGGGSMRGTSPGATSGGSNYAANDECTCQFKHTFIFLGRVATGKSATRINMTKEDKWFSFLKKETPHTTPTFAFESNKATAGALSKAEVTLLELSGNEAFTTLEPLIPDRRVTYCICFRLNDSHDLSYFRNYLEFITCHSPSNETTIVLLATFRDEVRGSDKSVVDSLQEVEAQVSSFLKVLQPQEIRRPRFVAKFAVSNKTRAVVSPSQKITKMPDLLAWFGDHAVTRCKLDSDFPHGLIPMRVMTLGRKLSEMKAQGKYILPTSDYKALARVIDARYEKQLGDLHKHTQLLHSWGVVHHHYRHTNMKRSVVIDTNWVFNLIATLSCCIDTGISSANAAVGSGGVGTGTSHISNILAGNTHGASGLLRSGIGVYAPKIADFGERLPFNIHEIARVDSDGLICRGVMTIPVAVELFRGLMKEKGIAVKDVDIVLELLESYDLIVKGSRLKQWYPQHQAKVQQRSRQASMMQGADSPGASNGDLSNRSLDRYLEEDDDEEVEEEFYMIPSCFQAPLPQPVSLHLAPILFGPNYRFSMNMVPPFFFPRFVARISRYAQKLYMGPATCNSTKGSEEQLPAGTPGAIAPISSANFWINSLWIIDSSSARAFVRMVHRSLFITFHDHEEESPFHNGLLEVVRFLVHESPGMQCEEAVLARRVAKDGHNISCGSADGETGEELWLPLNENVNSLEKIREREEMALRSARGAGPQRDANGIPIAAFDDDDDMLDDDEPELEIVRNPRDTFDDEAALEKISNDCFVDDEVMQKIQHALRLIKKGRTLCDDPDRGAKIEGAGVDQLVDALAHA